MLKIDLCSGKVRIKNGMSLVEVRELLDSYRFIVTNTDNVIIYHGKLQLDDVEKIVVHLYFEPATRIIQSAVVHTFPINFNHVQNYLIAHHGEPTMKKSDYEFVWTFLDGEITHSIIDRFGDEEGIYYWFNWQQIMGIMQKSVKSH